MVIFKKRDADETVAVDNSSHMKGEEEQGLNESDQGRLERDNCRGAKRSGAVSFLKILREKPSKLS